MNMQETFLFIERVCASLEYDDEYIFEFESSSHDEHLFIKSCLEYFCKDIYCGAGPALFIGIKSPGFHRVILTKNRNWSSDKWRRSVVYSLEYRGVQLFSNKES